MLGTEITFVEGTLSAEALNANTFIHAQIVMTEDILPNIFIPQSSRDFMYRPEPSGCVSLESSLRVVKTEQEINRLYKALHLPEVNLLKLMLVYPVPNLANNETIESYPRMSDKDKAELLHAFFLGRQKDPFTNEPHLEAVKLQRASLIDGTYAVPRIPAEDYPVVVLLTDLARMLNLPADTLNSMRNTFEQFIQALAFPTNIDIDTIRKKSEVLAKRIVENNVEFQE